MFKSDGFHQGTPTGYPYHPSTKDTRHVVSK